ncbi:MAG: hypothetical protein VYC34_04345, partial [Planctomycetota bacterium]|nr:hypothetical protein [Planctomycetota bacterium]
MTHRSLRAAAALAAASCAAVAAAQFTFDHETVVADGLFNNRPSLAVDEAGRVHMTYTASLGSDSSTKEVWYALRPAGGGPWQFTQITDNFLPEEFPSLALDSAGNVHITFHTNEGGNRIRYTNNISGSFMPNQNITNPSAPFFIIPKLDVDSTGVVHFTFTGQNNGPDDVWYTTREPNGVIGPRINVSQNAGTDATTPSIDVGPDDDVHIVYANGLISGPLVYKRKAAASSIFVTIPTLVLGSVTDPVVRVSESGVVSIIYCQSDILYVIDDGGVGTFGAATPLFNDATYRPAFYDNFAIDDDGNRLISVASNVGEEGVFFVGEKNGSFTLPQRFPGETLTYFGSSVGVNSDGFIAVAYNYGSFDSKNNRSVSDLYVAILVNPCPADLDGDGAVGPADLGALLGSVTDPVVR